MNSKQAPPSPSEAARAMQKRAAAVRWEKLSPEERSQQMRTLRLKKIRRKYVVTVIQDHRADQRYPFTVTVRSARHGGFSCDVQGKNLAHLLNNAADAIFAREEPTPSPRDSE